MPSSQVPEFSSMHDELRDGRGVEGDGYVPPGPSNANTSQRQGFGIDVVVSVLEHVEHVLSNVCSELQKVPTTVERLSCINGILPEGHQFNAKEAVDYIEMESIFIGDMRDDAADLVQSSIRLLNNMKCLKTMQDSRCKPYEESPDVVIRQIEQDEAAVTDSRAGDGTEANVSDHETNDVGLERPIVDDEAAATDSRADDGTEANVSDHHPNNVGLDHPVVDETSHNVEAVVDSGVNDPPTDKCKGPVVGNEPCSPVGDVPLNVSSSKINDVAVNASKTKIRDGNIDSNVLNWFTRSGADGFDQVVLDCTFYDDENKEFNVKSAARDFKRMVQVMKAVYGDAQYNASKQPKWELSAKKPMFVKVPLQGANECGHYTLKYAGSYDGEKIVGNIRDNDPHIVDWKAEDLYRVVFNWNNQLLVTELPKEFQPLAPGA
ncbi:hypothetical protein VPH35_123695 [Triticum aestivum]